MRAIVLISSAIIHIGYIGATVYLPAWASSVAMLIVGYSILVPSLWYHHTRAPITRTQYITLNSATMLVGIVSNAINENMALPGFIVSSAIIVLTPIIFRIASRAIVKGRWENGVWVCPAGANLLWELGACRAKNGATHVVVPETADDGEIVRLGWDVWTLSKQQ